MPFVPMGLDWFRESDCYKRKFRFAFFANSADRKYIDTGVNALPPQKGARPSLAFKEIEVQHLTETIYYPGKPDWKPVTFTLYDIMPPGGGRSTNPIFDWIKLIYNPQSGDYHPVVNERAQGDARYFKKRCCLFMLNGCGDVLEKWVFEGAWPQESNFGELDMGNMEIATCEVTLRYDRAWIETLDSSGGGNGGTGIFGNGTDTGGPGRGGGGNTSFAMAPTPTNDSVAATPYSFGPNGTISGPSTTSPNGGVTTSSATNTNSSTAYPMMGQFTPTPKLIPVPIKAGNSGILPVTSNGFPAPNIPTTTTVALQGGTTVLPGEISEGDTTIYNGGGFPLSSNPMPMDPLTGEPHPLPLSTPTSNSTVTGTIAGQPVTWVTGPFGHNKRQATYAKIGGAMYPVPAPYLLPGGAIPGLPKPGKAAPITGK